MYLSSDQHLTQNNQFANL